MWRKDFITDNGNIILDIHDLAIADPAALERDLNQIAGVVTVGLFATRPAEFFSSAPTTECSESSSNASRAGGAESCFRERRKQDVFAAAPMDGFTGGPENSSRHHSPRDELNS